MPEILGHNFIAGQRSAAGTTRLQSLDATTGEALPYQFTQATETEVDQAAKAAAAAFVEFRQLAPARRAEFLDAIAAELDQLDDSFVAVVCRETALPAARIQGERGRTSGQMRLFAQVLRRGDFLGARIDLALPDRQPLPRVDLRQMRIGVGPVAVFGASNFPLAFSTAGGDKHPAIQAVGFTGSLKGGDALCRMAAERPQPIPVFAEMSSINPVIVLPGALAKRGDAIARELAGSVCMGAGQFCTNPGLVIGLQSPQYSQLLGELGQHLDQQAGQTMLNAGGLRSYVGGLEHLKAHAGIEHLAGQTQEGSQARAQLFKADARLLVESDPLLQEEVFGPTTVAVEVKDNEQLRAALLGLRGQLTATLIGKPSPGWCRCWKRKSAGS